MLRTFVFRRRTAVILAMVLLLLGVMVSTTQAAGPAAPGGLYVVRPGDTLIGIAMRFHVSPWELAAANGLPNPNYVRVGQRLLIPGHAGHYVTPVKAVPVKAVSKGLPPGIALGKLTYNQALKQYGPLIRQYRYKWPGIWHTVRHGQTLASIAMRYGSHPVAIAAANLLPNPNVIYAGERLWVPKLY